MTFRILGIGIDVADPRRIADIRARHDIMRRVLAEDEGYLWPLSTETAADVWATKEAVAKSLGTGFWQKGIEWTNIHIVRDGSIGLSGAAADLAGESHFHVQRMVYGDMKVVFAIRFVGRLPAALVDNLLDTARGNSGI